MMFKLSAKTRSNLVFIFALSALSISSPAHAGGSVDSSANLQKLEAENRLRLTTWASRHRSFPQINPQTQDSLGCFMQTEDGRILNLQAICGNAGNASPIQPQDLQNSTHTP